MPASSISFRHLIIVALSLLLAAGMAGPAAAQADGEYILQCSCPIGWSAPWEGAGTFDEADSLDTVALANGSAVLLIHEIRFDDGTVEGMIEDRSAALDDHPAISDLDDAFSDDSTETASIGRTWVNADGEAIYSFQYVQVWEDDFLLSIEFVAPAEEFADAWASLEDVLLVGMPVFVEFDGEEIASQFEGGDLKG